MTVTSDSQVPSIPALYRMYRQSTGRVALNIRDYPGADTPVLFIHGFSANGLASLRLGKLLAGRRRLIAPDLRGRGLSDMPVGEYGITTHSNDLAALLDRLNVDKVVLAGHSFGATISLFLGSMLGDRLAGLILYDGGAMPAPHAASVIDHYYSTLTYQYSSIEAYVARFQAVPQYQPWTEELDLLVRSNLRLQPDGTYVRTIPRFVVEADRRSENVGVWQQLPMLYKLIHAPVLIVRAGMGVFGIDDCVISDDVLNLLIEALPQAQVVTIPEAGHTTILTMPSRHRDQAIVDFLKLG